VCAQGGVAGQIAARGVRPASLYVGRVCASSRRGLRTQEITTGRRRGSRRLSGGQRRCGEGEGSATESMDGRPGDGECVAHVSIRPFCAVARRGRSKRKGRQAQRVPAGHGDGVCSSSSSSSNRAVRTAAMGRFSFREEHRLRLRSAIISGPGTGRNSTCSARDVESPASSKHLHACTSRAPVAAGRMIQDFLIASPARPLLQGLHRRASVLRNTGRAWDAEPPRLRVRMQIHTLKPAVRCLLENMPSPLIPTISAQSGQA
jgi:hypothetical protein